MILRLTLDLPEERGYIKIIRLLGRTLLEHLNVIEQDVDEVEVIVGELCANVIRHAHSVEGRFRVILEYLADRVVIQVEDKGPGFAREAVAPVGAERPDFDGTPSRIGGYGLRLVELLSDQVDFRPAAPNGTTVRAERRLHFRAPADALHAAHLANSGGGFAVASLGGAAVSEASAATGRENAEATAARAAVPAR